MKTVLWRMLGRMFERRNANYLAEICLRKACEQSASTEKRTALQLGRLLLREQRYADALVVLENAVSENAASAALWNALGVARRETGSLVDAGAAFRKALELDPGLAAALNNLGNWHLASGEAEQALEWFDRALAAQPHFHEALNNRVAALLALGRSIEARDSALHALALFPESAALQLNLGNCHMQLGDKVPALRAYKAAIAIDPAFEEAHFNHALLGDAEEHLGKAINTVKKRIAEQGRTPDLLNRLAVGHVGIGAYVEAVAICRELLQLNPDFYPAQVSLAVALAGLGENPEVLSLYGKAVARQPDNLQVFSNYLFHLNYSSEHSAEEIFQQHVAWASRHDIGPRVTLPEISGRTAPPRRLRIGYVSPDLRTHPVGFLIRGVLRCHDRTRFEIHCFSGVAEEDVLTKELRRHVDVWHDVLALDDNELAALVMEQKIDILLDLSGHTGGQRLSMFSKRPAPVQATWLGYFHSTGMQSIDYFITDPHTSPAGSGQLFTETPVWLPDTRFLYSPPEYAPQVAEAPHIRNGFVTFGCFNKLAKMTDEVVQVWSSILARLPDARLWLKNSAFREPQVCESISARFAAAGIGADRLVLRQDDPHGSMLAEYAEIDIALDPFPFSGGMTTFEALWMGVPVVTLAGSSVVARQSVSALKNLGRDDLIFDDASAYVDGAVALARDSARMIDIRSGLRPAMQTSALCDAARFTGELENLYQRMWDAHLDNKRLPSDV